MGRRLVYCSVLYCVRGYGGEGAKTFCWCGTISDVLLINFRVLFRDRQCPGRIAAGATDVTANQRTRSTCTDTTQEGMGPLQHLPRQGYMVTLSYSLHEIMMHSAWSVVSG